MASPDKKITFGAFDATSQAMTPAQPYDPFDDDEIPDIDEVEDSPKHQAKKTVEKPMFMSAASRRFEADSAYFEMQELVRQKARPMETSLFIPHKPAITTYKQGNEVLQLSPLNDDDDSDDRAKYISFTHSARHPETIHLTNDISKKKSQSPPKLTSKHVRLLSHRDHDKEGMRERLKAKLDKKKELNDAQALKHEKKDASKNRKGKPQEVPQELLDQFDDFVVGTKNKEIPKKAKKYKNPQPQKAKKDDENQEQTIINTLGQDINDVDEGISFSENDKDNSVDNDDSDTSTIDEGGGKVSKESSTESDIITCDDQCAITEHRNPRYIDRRTKSELQRDELMHKHTDELLRRLHNKYFNNEDVKQYVPNSK